MDEFELNHTIGNFKLSSKRSLLTEWTGPEEAAKQRSAAAPTQNSATASLKQHG